MIPRPDTAAARDNLKDFQLRTVDYVFNRLYGSNSTRRFLVADEVGLGKTLVARGVIARAIDHLWDQRIKHIEIIYICSNVDIARQNVRRLLIPGCATEGMRATRLSMLPLYLRQRGKERVNFIALTPGTSFELTGGSGRATERALLYQMLREPWGLGNKAAPQNVLAGNAVQGFNREIREIANARLDKDITGRLIGRLRAVPELRQEFDDLCQLFARRNWNPTDEARTRRQRWVGKMRTELTKVCIASLRPSLIIMDEFQRFRDLLNPKTEAGQLAGDLLGYSLDRDESGPRTLLLSATPYTMLSMQSEESEDHYADLLSTLAFLDGPSSLPQWKELFRNYQRAMLRITETRDDHWQLLAQSRDRLAQGLRRVMVRTERLAASPERCGMLRERNMECDDLAGADVRAWFALQEIADTLKQGDCIEYWKSAPYVLNFMDRYQLNQAFHEACRSAEKGWEMHKLVSKHADSFLPFDRVRGYKTVLALNARLRALQRETLEANAWKLLWVPPALPHYQLSGVFSGEPARTFTKSLIFSAWHVVPKAVSALLSYEAERHMMRLGKRTGQLTNTAAARKKRRPLLRFAQSERRLTGLPLFTLVYPSLTLAKIADPLKIRRERETDNLSLKGALEAAEVRITAQLTPLLSNLPTHGPEDEAWYWLAPMLLDKHYHPEQSSEWWAHSGLWKEWMLAQDQEPEETQHHDAWEKHVAEARKMVQTPPLSRPPADLFRLLAQVAVAAPATCALRSLSRDEPESGVKLRLAAAGVGHAFLALFNVPEVRALLLGINPDERYWRVVLDYACDGGLQAMLDEFTHLLREDRPVPPDELSTDICEAMRLRTAIVRADDIRAPKGKRRVSINAPLDGQLDPNHDAEGAHLGSAMRVRFAMRFGDDRAETDERGNRREIVRHAFNSPFWPFVLVTTSVGQEGLDFHRYCHRVIHWNLPSNPVDLEQREGRVHRYKGHAVRKNLSQTHWLEALRSSDPDAWRALFEAGAAAAHEVGDSEIVPFWIFPGDAKIERCVPHLPMSRETTRLQQLRRALTVYRLAFGHARQEDVIEHLLARVPAEKREQLCEELRINLAPPIAPVA